MTLQYLCICGGTGNATDKGGYWLFGCFKPSCQVNRRYVPELAEAYGLPSNAPKDHIAAALAVAGGRVRKARSDAVPLPSLKTIARQQVALGRDPAALAWLHARGFTEPTRRRLRLGRSNSGITIPVRSGREVINVVTATFPRDPKRKYVALAGHPAALYAPGGLGDVALLVAGICDAGLGWQEGLPVAASTTGSAFPAALAPAFAGKRVAVAFDVGEEQLAETAAAKLVAAGAEAWVVPLPMPDKGDDLTDWFIKYSRTARELRRVVRNYKRRRRA